MIAAAELPNTVGEWLGGLGGVAATLWVGWQLFRAVTSDGREATSARMAALESEVRRLQESTAKDAVVGSMRIDIVSLGQRVSAIELDEREEKGLGLPAKVEDARDRVAALEGTALAEIRSAREKLAEVDVGIQSLLARRANDG